jgi:DNA-binding FadR family transcriptional regulator
MLLLEEIKYLELYELREILEPAAAALAARRATPDDLEQMKTALNGMKLTMDDPESFIRYEMEFHNTITRASKNGAMHSTMQMMYGALSEGRHRVLPLVHNIAQHCARHQRMFKLIANRDATGARRAVIADVKYAESLLQRNLHDNENDFRKNPKKVLKTSKKPARKTSTKKSQGKPRLTGGNQ